MATATAARRVPRTQSADPTALELGEDGFRVRYEDVDGEPVAFSLKPYPETGRPLYWNPIYPGCEMRWRSRTLNDLGFQPTIQKERWTDGKFYPRNAWEEHMTREWMKVTLRGCNDPDKWKGVDHPKGGEWRCQCTWHTGNWEAFEDHRRQLRHQQAMDD